MYVYNSSSNKRLNYCSIMENYCLYLGMRSILYTVKKVTDFPVFSRDVITKLASGSLVRDIPYEDGKTANLFYSV